MRPGPFADYKRYKVLKSWGISARNATASQQNRPYVTNCSVKLTCARVVDLSAEMALMDPVVDVVEAHLSLQAYRKTPCARLLLMQGWNRPKEISSRLQSEVLTSGYPQ